MAQRRRRPSYHVDAEVTASPGWLSSVGAIPLFSVVGVLVTLSGFYYVTKEQIGNHEQKLKLLETKFDSAGPQMTARIDSEAAARIRARDEFLTTQKETATILGQIAARLAVSETKQETTNKSLDSTNNTLSKIADQLQQISNQTSRPLGGRR